MKKLLIVYHTLTGGSGQMARAAAAGGARQPEVATRTETAAAAGPDEVLGADGYLFACPRISARCRG